MVFLKKNKQTNKQNSFNFFLLQLNHAIAYVLTWDQRTQTTPETNVLPIGKVQVLMFALFTLHQESKKEGQNLAGLKSIADLLCQ